MTLPSARFRVVIFLGAIATASVLAAPPAVAGLRDTFANVRDTVKCSTKAVFNPLRVVDWGMKNFETLTSKEYERKADQTMKEALDECRAAAENIVARGFGVKMLGKARDVVTNTARRAKSAAAAVSKWYGKGTALADRRVALAVSSRERRFYEEEAGVLGSKPLPKPLPESLPKMDKQDRSDGATAGYRSGDNASKNPWNKYRSDGKRNRPNEIVTTHLGDISSDYGYQDRTVDDGRASEDPWNKYRSRRKRNRHNDESVSHRNDERPNNNHRDNPPNYTTRQRDQSTPPSSDGPDGPIAPGSESGSNLPHESGSNAAPRSQNCNEGMSPICSQVESTMKMRMAPIEARINAGGLSMSQNADLAAEMYKIILDHAPFCFATETRPHCIAANQKQLEEVRKAYESALETARQIRGE